MFRELLSFASLFQRGFDLLQRELQVWRNLARVFGPGFPTVDGCDSSFEHTGKSIPAQAVLFSPGFKFIGLHGVDITKCFYHLQIFSKKIANSVDIRYMQMVMFCSWAKTHKYLKSEDRQMLIEKFGLVDDIVEDVITEATRTCKTAMSRDRWVAATVKAAAFLGSCDLSFLKYERRTGQLIFQFNKQVFYTSEDACQCSTFENGGLPCYHRALAKIVAKYIALADGAVTMVRMPQPGESLLKCQSKNCGWAGPEGEANTSFDREPMCPKCDSRELYEIELDPKPARAPQIRRQLADGGAA